MGADSSSEKSGAFASIAKALISGGIFIAFLVFSYVQLKGNPFESMMGDNLLEAATIVDQSSKSQMDAFTNAGGLDKESSWKGFQVRSIESVYHDTGKLGMLNLTLVKTWPKKQIASLDNLREALVESCGSSWKNSNVRGVAVLEAEGSPRGLTCSAMDQGGGDVLVSIVSTKESNKRPAASGEAATTSSAASVGTERSPSNALPSPKESVPSATGIATVAGELTLITKPGGAGGSVARLGGKDVFDAGDATVTVERSLVLEGKTVALLSLSDGGTACPALFRVLSIAPDGEVHTSEEFGTCSDTPRVTPGQTTMQISMPSLDGTGSSTWMYSSGTLHQVQGPKRK
jgi:hypothetical protein